MMIFKLAWREIYNSRRFSLFFIFNLAIGLSGLVAIDSLKHAIEHTLQQKAKGLLAADLSVEARRLLTPKEEEKLYKRLPLSYEESKVFESFTMVASPTSSRLVELKAIEENYPFYGNLLLKNQGLIESRTPKNLFQKPSLWVYPELLLQLNLKVGESVVLGSEKFEIVDLIEKDASGAGAGFNFAPPVYVARSYFEKSGLMTVGSTGQYSRLFKLPENIAIKDLVENLNRELEDPGIRITTSENASEQVGRLLGYLSDYLGLAALVALFLMSGGQIFLFRSFLIKRYRDMAILKILGLAPLRIFKLYITHILILSALALLPTLLLSSLLLPLLQNPLRELVHIDINVQLHLKTAILILLFAITSQVLTLSPLLIRIFSIRPKELLVPTEQNPFQLSFKIIFAYMPAFLAYWGLSMWLAKSYKVGSLFFILFISALLILFLLGRGFLFLISKTNFKNITLRFAIRNLSRSKMASISAFITLGLGVLLSNLIPLIESGLLTEIKNPAGVEQPSLFLFDVQEEQNESVMRFLKEKNINIMNNSPMIRARLNSVNNQAFEKISGYAEANTREEENENRFRNRGFNLTYRDIMTPSEKIILGMPFKKTASEALPQISLEKNFAARLKLKIGDTLDFDISGVSVKGRVVNLRKVRWTSFQPNFFIQFENGPLNDAPKTFLISLGTINLFEKAQLQKAIVEKFPNVSIIDISRVTERVTGIINQMSLALRIMSIFCLVVGLIILFSIANHQMLERKKDVNLLKVLGSSFNFIRLIYLTEFLLISILAATFGTLISFIMSYAVSFAFFDAAWSPLFIEPILIFSGLIMAACLIVIFVIERVLRQPARELLQSF